MKMNKLKKIIGWTILAAIYVGILSVPIIAMGWRDGSIICAITLAFSGMYIWAFHAITGE